jgi:ABC-type nitrate/sulfonate/bicarbonate transport system ATPase subunit
MNSFPRMPYKVELKGVFKSFRVDGAVLEALHDVYLHAEEGEFVTLIGPSGCGKSTLFNVICGLLRADEGQVLLDGTVLARRLGAVGYMPQKDLLLPWRSVLDNVILGPELRGENPNASRGEARELLPLFGLEGFADVYPAVLSGGMKQRAALLRTFLTHREVLLLDEPFGALDALTRMDLQEWLLDIWARFRKTILFITHDVDEAVFLSDRVYVLTPRPGHVKLVASIPLPRPRQRAVVASPEFAALRYELLDSLRSSSE